MKPPATTEMPISPPPDATEAEKDCHRALSRFRAHASKMIELGIGSTPSVDDLAEVNRCASDLIDRWRRRAEEERTE